MRAAYADNQRDEASRAVAAMPRLVQLNGGRELTYGRPLDQPHADIDT
jgi:hypothetical protein